MHTCEHPQQDSCTPLTHSLLEHAASPPTTTTTTRTNGELIEGDGRCVVTQGIADTYGDLVLDG